MCLLNKNQVAIIKKDVEQANITLSHLADDLIDHICCELETKMSQNQTFEDAYQKVKQEVGLSVLKQIQDDTQFLIDKNYRFMKSIIKIIGNVSLALIVFGTVFKIMYWPGASIILTLGFALVCVVFFPLSVYLNYKKVSQSKRLLHHIVILISGIAFMVGVIFKIMHWPYGSLILFLGYLSLIVVVLPLFLITKTRQTKDNKDKKMYFLGFVALMIFAAGNMFKMFHWPGATILLIVGATLLISVFLPLYTWESIKKEGKITGSFIYSVIVSAFLVMFTSLVVQNTSQNQLDNFIDHGNNERQISLYLKNKNDAYINKTQQMLDSSAAVNQIAIIDKKARDIIRFIDQVKEEVIKNVEVNNNKPASYLTSHTEFINFKTNETEVYKILIGKHRNGKAYQLKTLLKSYKKDLTDLNPDNKSYIRTIEKLIDLSDKKKWGEVVTWEHYHLYGVILIDALATLETIESKVYMAEDLAINQLKY